jgi:hypothetical protein
MFISNSFVMKKAADNVNIILIIHDKVKHAAYMPLEKIDDTDVINVGHLSAENKNSKLSLFDRLPVLVGDASRPP